LFIFLLLQPSEQKSYHQQHYHHHHHHHHHHNKSNVVPSSEHIADCCQYASRGMCIPVPRFLTVLTPVQSDICIKLQNEPGRIKNNKYTVYRITVYTRESSSQWHPISKSESVTYWSNCVITSVTLDEVTVIHFHNDWQWLD